VTHVWRARWDGPDASLGLRWNGTATVAVNGVPVVDKTGQEQGADFAVAHGAVLTVSVKADQGVVARLMELTPAGERLPGFGHPVHKPLDPRAAVGEGRELLGLEEVGGPEVLVAIGHAGVNARGVDGDLHLRGARVPLVHRERALPLGEPAAHLRDHQVAHGEVDAGVHEIEGPIHSRRMISGPAMARHAGWGARLIDERQRKATHDHNARRRGIGSEARSHRPGKCRERNHYRRHGRPGAPVLAPAGKGPRSRG
jgi:hypothetical protein